MRKKWLAAVAAGFLIAMGAAGTASAADGTWIPADGGWKYLCEDGNLAKNSWEDIDGEWYYFGGDTMMVTGWQKVGNLRYYFEADGHLSEGWQCYTGDGDEKWYYFDKTGNAAIRWLHDDGKWYWFNGNGILSTETSKTIEGKKYYFNEDGSLRANEYAGFKYMDIDGQFNSRYDVRAENSNGNPKTIGQSEREEIAEELNELPKGWLKRFLDDGWTFVYCPEKDYYSSARFEDSNDRYYIRYKLDTAAKLLRFSDKEAVQAGFGEYMYKTAKSQVRELLFNNEVRYDLYEILEFTEMPEYYSEDYETIFGALFTRYLDEDESEETRERFEDICVIFDRIIASVGPDGRDVK